MLLTTPAWIYLLRALPRLRSEEKMWWRLLWGTAACVGLPALFYQNTGYAQFGYRFSIDYSPYLMVLLAMTKRPLTPWFKALILWSVGVNVFGAITFKRFMQFYMPGATFFDPD